MKTFFHVSILLTFLTFSNISSGQGITCKLKGTIVGRESTSILLLKQTEDVRYNRVEIPIKDNRFEYVLKTTTIEQFQLVFNDEYLKGESSPIKFFPENCTVEFILNPITEARKNSIQGGSLNREMNDFNEEEMQFNRLNLFPYYDTLSSWKKDGKYWSEKYQKLFVEKFKNTEDDSVKKQLYGVRTDLLKSGEAYTPQVVSLNKKCDSIEKQWLAREQQYIRTHIDLFSFSRLLAQLDRYNVLPEKVDISFINEIYPLFAAKYPSHPYTKKVKEILIAIKSIKVGGQFIDFTSQTVDGKIVRLSDVINGKVALIDLWASWCGSCRVRSKSVIPVYEKYKNKGFVVVGIACEYKNTEAFKGALKHDKYPWLNLVELDNKNGIWNKYNLSGAGGSTVLVDAGGKILAILPTAGELDKLLNEVLK